MKRPLLIPVVLAAAAAFLASALPAFSAESGTVTAQVTVQTACITLEKSSLDWGQKPFTQPGDPGVHGPLELAVTNCGAAAKLFGRGTDAKNGPDSVTWALTDASWAPCASGFGGPNRYSYFVGQATPNWIVKLTTTDQQLLGNSLLGAGSVATMGHGLTMPCTGSDGSGQTMSWQVVFTATL